MAVDATSIWKKLITPGTAAPTSGGSKGVNNAWQRLMTPDPSLVPSKQQLEEEERKRQEAQKRLMTHGPVDTRRINGPMKPAPVPEQSTFSRIKSTVNKVTSSKPYQMAKKAGLLSVPGLGDPVTDYISEFLKKQTERPQVQAPLKKVASHTEDLGLKFIARITSRHDNVPGSKNQSNLPTYEERLNELMKGRTNPDNGPVKKFMYELQSAAPQTAIGVGLALLTRGRDKGALSSAYFAALSANEQIEKKGKVDSLSNIGIDVALDRFLGEKLVGLFKQPAKSITAEILKNAGIEGSTEVSQSILKMANDFKNARSDRERQKILDDAKRYITEGEALMEFAVGGTVGAGITGVSAPAIGNSTNISVGGDKEPPSIRQQLGVGENLQAITPPRSIRDELEVEDGAPKTVGQPTIYEELQPKRSADMTPEEEQDQAYTYTRRLIEERKAKGQALILDPDEVKLATNNPDTLNHAEYSKAIIRNFQEILKEVANPTVKFTAGGPASGKTDFIVDVIKEGHDGIILDGTLASYKHFNDRLEEALNAGKKVEINYVLSDPVKAWGYAESRKAETGRGIDLDGFIDRHVNVVETIKTIIKEHPNVRIRMKDTRSITNSQAAKELPFITNRKQILDILNKLGYSKNNLIKQINGQSTARTNQKDQQADGRKGSLSNRGRVRSGDKAAERNRSASGERRKASDLSEKDGSDQRLETKKQPKKKTTPSKKADFVIPKGAYTIKLMEELNLDDAEAGKVTENEKLAHGLKTVLKGNIGITKAQMKLLLKEVPGLKDNPVLTVLENGNLGYQSGGTTIEINPTGLGLSRIDMEDFMKTGDKVYIDIEGFVKPSKKLNNVRLVRDGTVLASRNSQKLGVAEQLPDNRPELTPAKPGTPQYKTFQKVEELIRKYAKLVGEGYLPRNARGVYYHDTANIFVDGMTNVSVAAHEITHFLDKKYNVISQLISDTKRGALIRKQLTDFYVQNYSGGNKTHKLELRMREGYASLIQRYALTPQAVTASHPNLVEQFILPGGKFYQPVISEVITDIQGMVDDYQGLSSLDKVGANIATEDFKTNKGNFMNIWQQIRTVAADDIYFQEVLDKGAGIENTDQSVSLMMRGLRNHTSPVFQSNLSGKRGLWTMNQKGEMVKVANFNIGNLIQQLSDKKIMDEFAYYLVARDGYFEHQRLMKLTQEVDTASNPEAREVLEEELKRATEIIEKNPSTPEELAAAYNENKDRFKEEEAMFDELTQKGGLDILRDSLLMDEATYEELSSREGYASKKRVFYNELLGDSDGPASLGAGGARVSSTIARKGSSRVIQNPLYSLIKDHHEIMNKAGRQHVYNRMLNVAKSPKWGEIFQIQKLKTDAKGQSEMYRDPNYIMAKVKDGGKVKTVPILTDKLVKNMVDNVLTYDDIHIVEKVLRTVSTIKTIGTTAAYPAFGAVNIIRDQSTAYVFSQNNYKPFYTAMHEFYKSLNPNNPEHQFMKEFFVLGGDHYTLVSFDGQSPEQALKSVARELTAFRKYSEAVIGGGVKVVQAPAKYSEVATRAAEFVRARMAGKDQWTAMEDAQRVSGPFAHIGALQKLSAPKTTKGQTGVKSIPFANAGIQILDQTIRTLETNKGRQRFLFAAAVIAVAMGGGLLYMRDEASEDQKKELRGTNPEYLVQYIFIPKSSGQGFLRIPLPQNLSTFAGMVNMAILDKWLDADYKFKDYVSGAMQSLPQQLQLNPWELEKWLFSFSPQLATGTFQAAWGMRTFPKLAPVESQGMKRLPSEHRYTDNTSPVAKFLGKTEVARRLKLSPIKIDNAATAILGRASGLPLGNKKALNPLSGFEQSYYWQSSRVMDKYWKRKEEIEQEITARKNGYSKSKDPIVQKEIVDNIGRAMTAYDKLIVAGKEEDAKKVQKIIEDLADKLK